MTPISRRSLLKSAGAALAGLAMPGVVQAAVKLKSPPAGEMIVHARAHTQMTITARGSREGVVPRVAQSMIGTVNSRPVWGLSPGTLLYSHMESHRLVKAGGIIEHSGTVYTFIHRDKPGWNTPGLSPWNQVAAGKKLFWSADFNDLWPDGDIPTEVAIEVSGIVETTNEFGWARPPGRVSAGPIVVGE